MVLSRIKGAVVGLLDWLILRRIRRARNAIGYWSRSFSANRKIGTLHHNATDQEAFREAVEEGDFERAAKYHEQSAEELEAAFDEAARAFVDTEDDDVTWENRGEHAGEGSDRNRVGGSDGNRVDGADENSE